MNGKKLFYKILLLSFVLFLCACLQEYSPSNVQEQEISSSVSLRIEEPESETVASITPQLKSKVAEKKQENLDTVGWVIVPGTHIDSAIVQNPPDDNSYYTTHDFYRNASKTATYSADRRCDFTSGIRQDIPNNIALYAHSFDENPDGELFSQLKKYKNPKFARTHPYIFFSTIEEDMVWEVFAVFDSSINLPYIIPNLGWDTLSNVVNVAYDASIYDYGVKITGDDKLLTLTCCTYSIPGKESLPFEIPNNYRFVVTARLVSPNEAIKEFASFTINDNPLPPDEMPMIYHTGQDLFIYDGIICFNTSDVDGIMQLDWSNATPVGEIKRTGITMDLQDWDAIILKAGTKILQHNEEQDLLIAIQDGQQIPYLKMYE